MYLMNLAKILKTQQVKGYIYSKHQALSDPRLHFCLPISHYWLHFLIWTSQIFLCMNKHICIWCKILINRICNKQKLHELETRMGSSVAPWGNRVQKEADASLLAGTQPMKSCSLCVPTASQLPLPLCKRLLFPCRVVACRDCRHLTVILSDPK